MALRPPYCQHRPQRRLHEVEVTALRRKRRLLQLLEDFRFGVVPNFCAVVCYIDCASLEMNCSCAVKTSPGAVGFAGELPRPLFGSTFPKQESQRVCGVLTAETQTQTLSSSSYYTTRRRIDGGDSCLNRAVGYYSRDLSFQSCAVLRCTDSQTGETTTVHVDLFTRAPLQAYEALYSAIFIWSASFVLYSYLDDPLHSQSFTLNLHSHSLCPRPFSFNRVLEYN